MEKQKIIYLLYQIDRLGHLVLEPFCLRNLYDESKFDLTIVTLPPDETPKVNKAVYEIMLRGLKTIQVNNHQLVSFGHRFDNILNYGDYTYLLLSASSLLIKFTEIRDKIIYYCKLSEEEIEKGKKLREKFNIPITAKIVTLHIREGGDLPHLKYHSYRNADIDNYLPAIEYLIEKGFYIIRFGNNTMKPIKINHPQIIDTPFHTGYCNFVEPYFIANSTFYMGNDGGPIHLAQVFNIPILATEIIFTRYMRPITKELGISKKYYSTKLKRFLNLQEILSSSLLNYSTTEEYDSLGIELHNNTKEEILNGVKEMLTYVNGTYNLSDDRIRVNQFIKKVGLPYYQLSYEFITANPYLLGHEF